MNNDLISRSDLCEKLQANKDFFVNAWGGFGNLPPKDKARVDEITHCIAETMNAPSVDAVIPVRCKDCKHGRKSDHAYAVDTAKPLCECNFMYGPHQWHEYCSWGKRRADDATD